MDGEIECSAGPSDGEEMLGTSRRRYRTHAREATSALGGLRNFVFNILRMYCFVRQKTWFISLCYASMCFEQDARRDLMGACMPMIAIYELTLKPFVQVHVTLAWSKIPWGKERTMTTAATE